MYLVNGKQCTSEHQVAIELGLENDSAALQQALASDAAAIKKYTDVFPDYDKDYQYLGEEGVIDETEQTFTFTVKDKQAIIGFTPEGGFMGVSEQDIFGENAITAKVPLRLEPLINAASVSLVNGEIQLDIEKIKTSAVSYLAEKADKYQHKVMNGVSEARQKRYENNVNVAKRFIAGELNEVEAVAFQEMLEADQQEHPDYYGAMNLTDFSNWLIALGAKNSRAGVMIETLMIQGRKMIADSTTPIELATVLAGLAITAKAKFAALMAE